MNKTTHTPRGLKSQKHIDRVLHNLDMYIAHYRVPQPQQLRDATAQLIAGNLGPRNAFYYDIQNEIYRLLHSQVVYLINLELQQEQEQNLQEQNQQQEQERQNPTPRQKSSQKSKIFTTPPVFSHVSFLVYLLALPASYHPPPPATHIKAQ